VNIADFQHLMHHYVFSDTDKQREAKSALKQPLKKYDQQELIARLNVYRNNALQSLVDVLADTYSSVFNTIGENLFRASAREYVKSNPPKDAVLLNYGHTFPGFLRDFGPTSTLGYLADLATVDLIRELSYYADDDRPIPAEGFAQMDIESLGESTITPLDSAYLHSSPFAIFDIWRLAQSQLDEKSIQAENPQHVLSIRTEYDVELYQLDLGMFTFLKSLREGMILNNALITASESQPDFDPTQAIAFLIHSGFAAQINTPGV